MVTILYFARLRAALGLERETVRPPPEVKTVAELAHWLRQRSPAHQRALRDLSTVRAAVDRRHAPLDAPLAGAREIALFPPVTGG